VDWDSEESSASEEERALVRHLKIISQVASAHHEVHQSSRFADNGPETHVQDFPPKTWGSLEILEQIGVGAFGTVFRAREPQLGRDVALKLFHAWRLDPSRQTTRIIEEGRRLAHVHHQNVVTVYGAEHNAGQIGLWMEFIEGSTLEQILTDQGPLCPDETMVIGRDVCRALAAVHDSGAIHRDIKASNVMREPGGRIVLMDLGVSCEIDGDVPVSQYGTPLYAAPEVLLQDESTSQSDIYSVGVLLFLLVTGEFPITGQTLGEVREAHQNRRIRSWKEICPEPQDLPDAFVRIFEQALAPDPAQRFTHAGQFEAALVDALGARAREFDLRRENLPSIAILPFEDRSPKKDHEYLCEGLAAGIIDKLSHLEGLHVVARSSSFAFKGQKKNLAEIGKALNVGSLLEGDIKKSGDRFRISSRLIDVADGRRIWSQDLDCAGAEVVTAEGAISLAIAENLRADFAEHEKRTMVKANTNSVEAYDLNLKALYLVNMGTRSDLEKAVEYFQLAITRDPQYANAYVGLAECNSNMSCGDLFSRSDCFENAKSSARKAVELDPMLARAHSVLGLIELFQWNWTAAERSARRAIEINPKTPSGHFSYAHYLMAMGRLDEAIEVMKTALERDPLSRKAHGWLGAFYLRSHQLENAREHLQLAHELQSGVPASHIVLGQIYMLESDFEAGLAELQTAVDLWENVAVPLAALGWGYAVAGRKTEALKILEILRERRKTENIAPYLLAKVYCGLGDVDQAFRWLTKAVHERDLHLLSLKTDETLEVLRSDPRYTDILHQMKLDL